MPPSLSFRYAALFRVAAAYAATIGDALPFDGVFSQSCRLLFAAERPFDRASHA